MKYVICVSGSSVSRNIHILKVIDGLLDDIFFRTRCDFAKATCSYSKVIDDMENVSIHCNADQVLYDAKSAYIAVGGLILHGSLVICGSVIAEDGKTSKACGLTFEEVQKVLFLLPNLMIF